MKVLNDWLSDLPVSSQTQISTSNAISTLRYQPSSNFTIRTICASVPQPFKATVYHRPSLYSRSREIQRREAKSRIRQFLISFIFAIPTFVFGIIGMVALPKSNAFRQWCDTPGWWGGASRAVILLFVFATLTMLSVTRCVSIVCIYFMADRSSQDLLCPWLFLSAIQWLAVSDSIWQYGCTCGTLDWSCLQCFHRYDGNRPSYGSGGGDESK